MKEKKEVGAVQIGMYGVGNFAAQLSWTMVTTFLTFFYTDVFGLAASSVAILMLVARVWDGINDPMMGMIMEKTQTRWGKYRPFIFVGAILLLIFTVLTFSTPNFGSKGKLIWAYITYIGLGMSYTMENVPFGALPSRMTKDVNKINKLFTSSMMGAFAGAILLSGCTLSIVNMLGGSNLQAGYQRTATVYATLALVLNFIVLYFCRENITVKPEAKQKKVSMKECLVAIVKNRNLMLYFLYTLVFSTAYMGRTSVMIYFFTYCVQNPAMMGVLMMLPSVSGFLSLLLAPMFMKKIGKRNTVIMGMALGALGYFLLFVGPYTNITYVMICSLISGLSTVASPCSGGIIIDAVDAYEVQTGVRNEAIAFSCNGLMSKIATGIGSAVGVAILGLIGYAAGVEVTAEVQKGINSVTNLIPAIGLVLAIVPMLFYNLSEKKMVGIRETLLQKNAIEGEE